MNKTFESLTKKTTQKKKKNREKGSRENQRDRQKAFEKVRFDSYLFLKNRNPISQKESGMNRISLENKLN